MYKTRFLIIYHTQNSTNSLEIYDEDELFTVKAAYGDEAIFHLIGHFNRYNVRLCGSNCWHLVSEGTKERSKFGDLRAVS